MTDEFNNDESNVGWEQDESGAFRPSRRKVLITAAWSVPVIAVVGVAGAAPAMAASPGVITLVSGSSCKHPGSSQSPFVQDYHFELLVKNTTGSDVEVCITGAFIGSSSTSANFSVGPSVVPVSTTQKCFTVLSTVGSTGEVIIVHVDGTNSANTGLTIKYDYDGVGGQVPAFVPSEDPCTGTVAGGPGNIPAL